MTVVGAVASVYHASYGRLRLMLRRADYWSIAFASATLRRTAVVRLPTLLSIAMTLAVPIKPTFVTAANLIAVEVILRFPCLKYVLTRRFHAGKMRILGNVRLRLAARIALALAKTCGHRRLSSRLLWLGGVSRGHGGRARRPRAAALPVSCRAVVGGPDATIGLRCVGTWRFFGVIWSYVFSGIFCTPMCP